MGVCKRANKPVVEEQFEILYEAATKAWALLPVNYQAAEILADALRRVATIRETAHS